MISDWVYDSELFICSAIYSPYDSVSQMFKNLLDDRLNLFQRTPEQKLQKEISVREIWLYVTIKAVWK